MSTVFVQWAHTLESAFLPNSLPPNQCITVIFVLFWNASNKTTHFQALNCLWQPNKNLYSAHKHQMCLLLRLRFGVTMSLNPKMEYQACVCVWASCAQCIAFKTFWHIFSIRLKEWMWMNHLHTYCIVIFAKLRIFDTQSKFSTELIGRGKFNTVNVLLIYSWQKCFNFCDFFLDFSKEN